VPWRADDLVAAVRLRCRLPDGDAAVSDAEILALADEEMLLTLTPAVRLAKAEYGVTYSDTTISGLTRTVRIPSRAQSGGLRDVLLVNSDGVGVGLPRIPVEERERYAAGAGPYWPHGVAFSVEGDKVYVLPGNAGGGTSFTLRLKYYRRPGRLVLAASAARIISISGADLTVAAIGDAGDGNIVDIVQGAPNFDLLEEDITADYAGPVMTLDAPNPEIARGDYITLSGTSPVVQLPDALHPVLVAAVSVRVYELMGNAAATELAQKKLSDSLSRVNRLINPRIEGEESPIVNRYSPLRTGRIR
jgi:hypothetical protein